MSLFGSRRRRERSGDRESRGRRGRDEYGGEYGRDYEREYERHFGRDYERDFGRDYERARYPTHPTITPTRTRSPRPYAQMPTRTAYPPAVNRDRTPGAILGSEYVAKLPLRRPSQLPSDRQTCGTCLEEYADEQDGVAIVQLPCCRNSIHRDCILDWVGEGKANHDSCPFCRRQLFTRKDYNGRDLEPDDLRDLVPDELQDGAPPPDDFARFGYDADSDFEDLDIPMNDLHFDRQPPQGAAVPIYNARFDNQRLQLADNRRQGALKDRHLYQQLLADGARLAGNLRPDAHVLNLEQDRAMFEELRRRGAFTQPGMDAEYRTIGDQFSDMAIYEDQRNRGRWWCLEIGRWHDKDGRLVTHFDDID